MSLEHRPEASRIDDPKWTEHRDLHREATDRGYDYLSRTDIFDPKDPQGTLTRIFDAAVHVEAQVAQVVSTSLGRGVTELYAQGVSLEELANMQLPRKEATRLADEAMDIHDLFGTTRLAPGHMADTLQQVVFPMAGLGTAFYNIGSLGDKDMRIPHVRGVAEFEDAPPPPFVTLESAQKFLTADARNPEIARSTYDVALGILLSKRAERDAYHAQLAAVSANRDIWGKQKQIAQVAVRADFLGERILDLANGVTPKTVEGLRPEQGLRFSLNSIGYVKLPRR
jgi:hypothetical protein